jgi:putative flippase GtrA
LTQLIALAQQNRKELTRFAKFLVVGAIGAAVDLASSMH